MFIAIPTPFQLDFSGPPDPGPGFELTTPKKHLNEALIHKTIHALLEQSTRLNKAFRSKFTHIFLSMTTDTGRKPDGTTAGIL